VRQIVDVVAAIMGFRAEHLNSGVSLKRQYDVLRTPGKSRLRDLHVDLDRAVSGAYGFSSGDGILPQLLALNQDVAVAATAARPPGPAGLTGARVTRERLRSPTANPHLRVVR